MDAYQAARNSRTQQVLRDFSPDELRKTAELLDRLAGAFVSTSANPDVPCMQCEIYYPGALPVRRVRAAQLPFTSTTKAPS